MKTKILKIIQIVYDILSLAFIAVVIAATAIAPKSEASRSDNTIDLVETKSRNNFFNRYGYLSWSPLEMLSDNLFYKRFGDAFFTMSIGGTYSMPYAVTDLRLQTSWTSFNVTNMETVYSNSLSVSSLQFYLANTGIWNGCQYQTWNFYINGDTNNYYVIDLGYYLNSTFPSPSYDNLILNNCTRSNTSFDYQQFIIPNRQDNFWYNYFIVEGGYQDGYDVGYQEGFDLGYDRGEDVGYNKGVLDVLNPDSTQYQYIYDLGKQEGIVEGMRGTESNAFIVIGQAFSAVGSIFSIEVLPNLPLWVLVFTPLIIVVVIVVVKLIKG